MQGTFFPPVDYFHLGVMILHLPNVLDILRHTYAALGSLTSVGDEEDLGAATASESY